MKRRAPNHQPSESDVTPQIIQAFTAAGAKLYRNNIGIAKMGQFWVAYGVGGKGGSDFIGYMPVKITPAMVGHCIAVFCAPEIKRPRNAEYGEKQVLFRDSVIAAGGIAGFVHSWEQARALIGDWWARFKPKN